MVNRNAPKSDFRQVVIGLNAVTTGRQFVDVAVGQGGLDVPKAMAGYKYSASLEIIDSPQSPQPTMIQRILHPLFALLASVTRQDLARQVAYLKEENWINREFQWWYNNERPHSARDHLQPGCELAPAEWKTVTVNDVVCEIRLGGALKTYWRRAG